MQENIEEWLTRGEFSNPHQILGLQKRDDNGQVIRLWRPGQKSCTLEVAGEKVEAHKIHEAGLFEHLVPSSIKPTDYRIFHPNGQCHHDPYAFQGLLGELDLHLIGRGLHYELFNHLGATKKSPNGVVGIHFSLWAPNARSVSLIGDFNHWDGMVNPMHSAGENGIWEIFIPGLAEGETYKFEVLTQEGEKKIKADPVAYCSEIRPKNASVVFDVEGFSWTDQEWIEKRGHFREGNAPINIYEVHLGSWKREEGVFPNYRVIARELADYCLEMGYTHVELMGICEHPLDESWGYQVTGYFSPTSRHGTPRDFQYLVNYLHQKGIGVILDWVPAHFPSDDHSLAQFDGTYLYEHMDPRRGFHPEWSTQIFNYGRFEVSNFLIASALFWLEKMHVDGLRVDAVSSMIYLDYAREPGEWIPNEKGENINLEAIEFIKHMNSILHKRFPDILMIAEEGTAFEGVTKPVEENGLGFDLKWNLGWMNDCLSFFKSDFSERSEKMEKLHFVLDYAFNEKYVLILSHDEVVHKKKSLFSKMPGDHDQKFAGLRLLLSMMITMPGKKLLFMGSELGQETEWNCKQELPWDLLEKKENRQLKNMVATLGSLYKESPALYANDFDPSQLIRIETNSLVLAFLRKSEKQTLYCIHNLGAELIDDFSFPKGKELFNSNREEWGGSGIIGDKLPPLSTLIIEVE